MKTMCYSKYIKYVLLCFITVTGLLYSQSWQVLPSLPTTPGRYEDLYFLNENTGWVVEAATLGRILKTTNGGASFVTQFMVDSLYFRSVAFNNTQLGWAGTLTGQLYKTTNGGDNWVEVDTMIHPPPPGFCDISVVGDSSFFSSGKFSGPTHFTKSTDGGRTFQYYDMGAYTNYQVGIYFFSNDTGFIAGKSNIVSEGAVVLFTSNGGNTWIKRYKSNIQNEHVWNIMFIDRNNGFASIEAYFPGNPAAIIKTTNGGVNWTRITVTGTGINLDPIGFANAQTGWTADHISYGLVQTTNGGLNWSLISVGSNIHGIFVINDSIAYASGKQVYKFSPALVGVASNETNTIPITHVLHQNFPNPFNSSTKISYTLARSTDVVLEIYNVEGRFIQTLYHGYQSAGEHSVVWNANNLPSGVYFYSLLLDPVMLYGKAVLVK
jgi:photosystem II stability/assembly factor-like uncharacterized protein